MIGNILITGASSGIGRQISIKLSEQGYQCILTGRDIEKLNKTLSMMSGSDHSIISGDINNHLFIHEISEKINNLIGVVHSAGIIKLLPLKFINKEDFDKIMNTNLYSPFFNTIINKKKKILNNSSILFISSISGPLIGSKGNLMYSASKSAVNGIVKVLALELADKKIRVNAISAGMIYSDMWKEENNIISSEQLIQDSKRYPLGYGKPSDVASLASFLVSNESAWITGSTIVLDGGFTIQ